MKIVVDNLSGPEVIALLEDHMRHMIAVTPPGCVHALDLEALKRPEITFWSVWAEASLLGCGALKELDTAHGEIKSMHTAAAHRGKGVASRLLTHIIAEARRRRYRRLSLETGAYAAFKPARQLYERFGFVYWGPFADYVQNDNSAFLTLEL